MKIIVKRNSTSFTIDTEGASIETVIDLITGALLQEGFPIGEIVIAMSSMVLEIRNAT